MKVLIVLGLLAVSALAVTQADKQNIEGSLKKKLIGGPNSLPYFLRPGYKKPEEKKRLIGGPDSLPYFLKPGYKKPETTEQSGLVEDVKVKTKKFGDKVKSHLKNAHAWLKNKLTKKTEVVAAPVVETSGFAQDAKVKATDLKNKIVKKSKEIKDKVVAGVKKAHKWFKGKLGKKEEVVAAPVAETSGFAQDAKVKATDLKDKIVKKSKEIKTKIVDGVKKAHKWLKNKLTKKTEVVAAPAVETSGFAQDAKVKAVNLKDKIVKKSKEIKDKVVAGVKKAHKWFKGKFGKKEVAPEVVVAPVAETSGFSEDASEKLAKAKETASQWWNKISNKAKEGIQYLKNKVKSE